MKHVLSSRRFWVAMASIVSLTALGLFKGMDVSWPIASIAMGIGAADAADKFKKGPTDGQMAK